MLNEKDLALLEAYTFGDISPAEETALKQRIQEDPEFAAAVQEWELWERAPLPLSEEELGENERIRAEITAALARRKDGNGGGFGITAGGPPILRWLLVAAAIIGVGLIGQWMVRSSHEDRPSPVIAAYLVPYPIDATLSESSNLNALLTEANDLYANAKYARAMTVYEDYAQQSRDSSYLLYAGVAALGADKNEAALRFFTSISGNQAYRRYHRTIDYYTILTYLALGRTTEASDLADNMRGKKLIPELREKLLELRQSGLLIEQ